MAYDWNTDDVISHELVKDPTVWNQYLASVQERAATVNSNLVIGAGDSFRGAIDSTTDGTILQLAEWWSAKLPSLDPIPTPEYQGMQAALTGFMGVFIDHRIVFEGLTSLASSQPNGCHWTFPALRTAAGLPTLYQLPPLIYADGSAYGYSVPNLATLPANSTWRRKRPRMIFIETFTFVTDYAYSDNFDMESNPAAVDQHAWHVDGLATSLMNCTATGTGGLFGTHGTWERTAVIESGTTVGPTVDVLDNALDSPSSLTTDNWSGHLFGSFALAATTYGTMCAPGDYLCAELFQEVRAITNLLRWQFMPITTNQTSYFAQVSSAISYADALGQIPGAWAPGAPSGGGMPGNGQGSYIFADYDGTNWTVTAQKWEVYWTFGIGGLLPMLPVSKDIKIYEFADVPTAGTGGGSAINIVWDAQGDDVTDASYHQVYDSGTTAATTLTTSTVGTAATPPSNAPPDPASMGAGIQGYIVTDSIAVADFTPGFTYLF